MSENKQADAAMPAPDDGPLPMVVVDRAATVPGGAGSRARSIFRIVRFVPLIMAILLTGAVVGMYFQPPGLRVALRVLGIQPGGGTADPIAVPADPSVAAKKLEPAALTPTDIIGLGRLLPEGDVVTVALPSGAGDARIETLAVREGDRVEAGAVLATLDNKAHVEAAVESARTTVVVREADLERARASAIASRSEAEAALASAEAAAKSASLELERTAKLHRDGILSNAALDAKTAAAEQAARGVEQARATLSRFATEGVDAQTDVVVALRNLDFAKAQLRSAEEDLNRAIVRSPIAGTVLDIHARPGEKPSALGIMELGAIDRMTAKVEIYQTQIGAVREGAAVTIGADALPQELTGTVERIGLQVKKQSVIDTDPAANTDARVVEVVVRLDPASSVIASRFTNLQVEARIKREATPIGTAQ